MREDDAIVHVVLENVVRGERIDTLAVRVRIEGGIGAMGTI